MLENCWVNLVSPLGKLFLSVQLHKGSYITITGPYSKVKRSNFISNALTWSPSFTLLLLLFFNFFFFLHGKLIVHYSLGHTNRFCYFVFVKSSGPFFSHTNIFPQYMEDRFINNSHPHFFYRCEAKESFPTKFNEKASPLTASRSRPPPLPFPSPLPSPLPSPSCLWSHKT